MTSANVHITVEMIVDGKYDASVIKEAKRVIDSALDSYGWHQVVKIEIVNRRND